MLSIDSPSDNVMVHDNTKPYQLLL